MNDNKLTHLIDAAGAAAYGRYPPTKPLLAVNNAIAGCAGP